MRPVSSSGIAGPHRDPDSHKGQNGLVLVIGGSIDYVGAPALAGLAALRAGCDMVRIAAPEKAAWAINALSPDLITMKLKGSRIGKSHVPGLKRLAKGFDAVLFGNGAGKLDRAVISSIARGISRDVPMVIDADAVRSVRISSLTNCILTPHSREFRMFLESNGLTMLAEELDDKTISDSERICMIQNNLKPLFAKGNVLLLKGRHDLVISGERSFIVKGGNAGMTVGGTGDILAGLCAGYLAQTADLFSSAVLASRNCKAIGDALLKKSNFGFGFIASDFLGEVRKLRASV
ncbi:NAD(P)H-hydrate dehydratase [Candidatus Woesearchaeota archaeon]|nr:NAD(P)H-hydrate dehydratase [Candidatus Woesearchaeota archaeon]